MERRCAWLVGAFVAVTLLGGCINYEEEMTLKRDGSGQVIMHYWMTSEFFEGMGEGSVEMRGLGFTEEAVTNQYEGKSGIEVKDVRIEDKEGDRHVYVTMAFESVDAFSAVEEGRTMTFSEEGGQITFTSTSEPGGPSPDVTEPSAPQPPSPAAVAPQERDPEKAAKHYQAGMSLKQEKKLAEAAHEFGQAIADDPDHLDAHWALAWTYASLEQNQMAVSEFEQVKRLAPPGSQKAKEAQEAMERLGGEPAQPEMGPAPEAMEKGMEEAMAGMMGGMMDSVMGEAGLTFTVHFPGEVLSVEGPGASKEGNTATWKCSLGELMKAGVAGETTMKATAKSGAGLPLIPVVIGVGALVAAVAGVTLMRRRRARAAAPGPPVQS